MLFDTDVLIWVLCGNSKAAAVLEADAERHVFIVTYMCLLIINGNTNQPVTNAFYRKLQFFPMIIKSSVGYTLTRNA
jgi:hypothetical protein